MIGNTRALQLHALDQAERHRGGWRDAWRFRFHNELATNLGLRLARGGECSQELLLAAADLMAVVGVR